MQPADLIKYIQQPQLLDQNSVTQLQRLVRDFPYFQSAHLLLSMAAKKWDTSVYQQSLKKTAIVVSNRANLFRLIHEMEIDIAEVSVETPVVETKPVKTEIQAEDTKQELDILKAAELSTTTATEEKAAVIEEKPVAELQKVENLKPVPDAEQVLEREIEKQVVTAFVEKEILKTPSVNRPEPKKEEQPESFSDWLSFLKKNNGQPYEEIAARVEEGKAKAEAAKQAAVENKQPVAEETSGRKQKNMAIIDKIIETNPGIIRNKEEQRFYAADIKAKESLLDSEHLVTETLARIYALQGSVHKAIRAYEILGIRHPQKRAYFDNLIQKLKNEN